MTDLDGAMRALDTNDLRVLIDVAFSQRDAKAHEKPVLAEFWSELGCLLYDENKRRQAEVDALNRSLDDEVGALCEDDG